MNIDLVAESALVHRCQQRDPAAFAELYELYVDRVYKHVYYLVRNRDDAEDLTAQAFLQAWSAIGRYQWRGRTVLSWLLTIAHNLVMSKFRSKRDAAPLHEGIAAQASAVASPEEAYIDKSQSEEILQSILRLKPVERQVILMRFVDNMEYEEVARAIGKSINAIRVIQYRALRNLRQMVSVEGV